MTTHTVPQFPPILTLYKRMILCSRCQVTHQCFSYTPGSPPVSSMIEKFWTISKQFTNAFITVIVTTKRIAENIYKKKKINAQASFT